jgi:glycosyltransferase 2 family protein
LGRKFRVQYSILGVLIGLGCIAVVLRQVDLRQSWSALGRLRGPFLLIPLAVFCLNLPLRAWRWQLIFPPSSRPNLLSCLTVLGIGNMANFLLPGRAGDLTRCALVGPTGSLLESSRTLATLALEKVLDGVALIAMVLFSIWVMHAPLWVLTLVRVASLIFTTVLVLLIVLRYRTHALGNVVRRALSRIRLSSFEEKIDHLIVSFSDGLSAVTSARQMVLLLLLTAAIWTTEAASIWGLAKALGLPVSLKSAVVASAILGLGFMIPGAPGGLGTYELFGTEAFKIAGVSASSALALTIMIHSWVFVANVVAGMALLGIKGLSLAQLKAQVATDSVKPAETESGARSAI